MANNTASTELLVADAQKTARERHEIELERIAEHKTDQSPDGNDTVAVAYEDGYVGKFWEKYVPKLLAKSRKLGFEFNEIEDLIQGFTMKLFLPRRDRTTKQPVPPSILKYQHQPNKRFLDWLLTAFQNYLKDYRKKKASRELCQGGSSHLQLIAEIPAPSSDDNSEVDTERLGNLLEQANTVHPSEYPSFQLHHIEELTLREAAEKLGISYEKVRRNCMTVISWMQAQVQAQLSAS